MGTDIGRGWPVLIVFLKVIKDRDPVRMLIVLIPVMQCSVVFARKWVLIKLFFILPIYSAKQQEQAQTKDQTGIQDRQDAAD